MRKLKRNAGALAILIAVFVAVLVPSAVATVWTDKEDYAPGETVTISGDNSDGAGYVAGETVHVDVNGPFGYTASCDGVADDNGAWSCQITLRDDESAEGNYSYTATGQTSGVSQSGTFTDQGGGAPANCVTTGGASFNPPNSSIFDQGFRDSNAAVGDMTVDLDVHNDAPGKVIATICIRAIPASGSPFALGGSGGDANSQAGGSAPGTSPHSIPITADGSGGDYARYGRDLEPGDSQDGCYTVSGIGTRKVSVTRAPTVDGAPNCLNLQHVDLFLTQPPPAVETEIHLDGDHATNYDGGSVPLGSTIHDKVTVTTNPATTIPAASNLKVSFFTTGNCTGSSTDANYDPSGGTSFTVDPANAQGPLHAGSYSYKAFFTSGDTNVVLDSESPCETVRVNTGDSRTVTEIHLGSGTGEGTAVTIPPAIPTTGSIVHDKATVSAAPGTYDGFSKDGAVKVTFSFYLNGTCSGDPVADSPLDQVALDANGVAHPSKDRGPLANGSYSFKASYPGNADYNASTSECEPFTVFTASLTPGYWKNHLGPVAACRGLKLPSGTSCSSNGPWTNQYLPQSLGNYSVDTILKAAKIFAAMNCNSSKDQAAIGCLAGHVLAAKLNRSNGGSGGNNCIDPTIANADAFLISINYLGPTGTYTLTASQRATAIDLKNKLDYYNNNSGCI